MDASDQYDVESLDDLDPLKWVALNQDTFVPASEIKARITAFQKTLALSSLEGALIKQNVDLYYFSGTMQDSFLFVPLEGDPLLMVYRNLDRAALESPLARVAQLPTMGRLYETILDNGYSIPKKIGLELDVLPVNLYFKLLDQFPQTEFQDVSFLIRDQRKIKSSYEIHMVREAGLVADHIFQKGFSVLKEGITEVEAAGLLEAEARRWGHQGYVRMRGFNQEMFYGHVISGPQGVPASNLDAPTGGVGVSAAFSHGSGKKRLKRGEPITVDLMGNYNGYHADQTRCFCIGPPGETLVRAYNTVREVLDTLREMLRPGTSIGDLYGKAHEVAHNRGYFGKFMGLSGSAPKFMGHGVGLEIDEFPFITADNLSPLEAGMVAALEPKIFLPGFGVVGIEDTILITEDGPENLTVSDRRLAVLPRH